MADLPGYIVVAAALIPFGFVLLVWGLLGIDRVRQSAVTQLRSGETRIVDEKAHRIATEGLTERVIRPLMKALRERAERLAPTSWTAGLERRLKYAGSPERWPLERVLGVKVVLGIVIAMVTGLILALRWPDEGTLGTTAAALAITLLAALAGYLLPDLLIYGRAQERQEEIRLALPDTLDQMTISVEAGLGFDAALHRSASAGEGALSEELRRVVNEIAIGVPRRQAFQQLSERTTIPELRGFVFAVMQAEEYGIPLARILRVQARELRVIRRQRAEERAMKMPVKLTFPLVLCILPSLFIVILMPALLRVLDIL